MQFCYKQLQLRTRSFAGPAMEFDSKETFNHKSASRKIPKSVFLLSFTLFIVAVVFLPLIRILSQQPSSQVYVTSLNSRETRRCNVFSGQWVPNPEKPYYTNETCPHIIDQFNCIKFGRPDTDFIKLRWKPNDCDLPLFDATQFLNLVRGKTMAFLGDSLGRNQMESLICLINTVSSIEDISGQNKFKNYEFPKLWYCADYNFSMKILWFPFLVKAIDSDPSGSSLGSTMNLYLDEADKEWVNKIQKLDYVIVSAGQWFYRPMTFYEKGQVVGYQKDGNKNLNLYGYRQAFRTTLRTIINQRGFKGLTFLVTHSPKHFEYGDWNEDGKCNRTKPFSKEEREAYGDGNTLEAMHKIQVEEFGEAEKEGRKKGLKFGLIDISDAMSVRPDGHPDTYGRMYKRNVKVTDCVHWCIPGPIDTWNEFLLYIIKLEGTNKSTLI